MRVWSLSWEDPLEEGKATHSSILAWRIPWREESGGLQSIGLQRMKWLSMHWSYFIHSKRSLVSSSHFSFKKQMWKLSPFLPVCCAHILLLILMCFKRNYIFISKFVYFMFDIHEPCLWKFTFSIWLLLNIITVFWNSKITSPTYPSKHSQLRDREDTYNLLCISIFLQFMLSR